MHWIRGWVGPRAGLDDMEKWKFLTPLSHVHSSRVIHSLYSSLVYYTTSQKVASSCPDNVIDFFFNFPNRLSRIMTLRFYQLLIQMSTRRSFWGNARPARNSDNPSSMSRLFRQCGILDISMASTAFHRDSFTFFFLLVSWPTVNMTSAFCWYLYDKNLRSFQRHCVTTIKEGVVRLGWISLPSLWLISGTARGLYDYRVLMDSSSIGCSAHYSWELNWSFENVNANLQTLVRENYLYMEANKGNWIFEHYGWTPE
jgi:hypothetical protein